MNKKCEILDTSEAEFEEFSVEMDKGIQECEKKLGPINMKRLLQQKSKLGPDAAVSMYWKELGGAWV